MAMPDPARTVTRTARMLRLMGVCPEDALMVIARSCQAARRACRADGCRDTSWLDQTEREALSRLIAGVSPGTKRHRKEHRHASTTRP